MEKPSTALWDKSYQQDMRDWVEWHVGHTEIDNLPDFMKWFMKMSKGLLNPQWVKESWGMKCQDICTKKKI